MTYAFYTVNIHQAERLIIDSKSNSFSFIKLTRLFTYGNSDDHGDQQQDGFQSTQGGDESLLDII